MHGRVSCDSPWFLPDFNGVAVNVLVSFRSRVACWQILLQKSQKAQLLIFRHRTKQATIADQ